MMDTKNQIQHLIEQYESEMATFSWASEDDRWAELIFCLVQQHSEQEPEFTRLAVSALQNLSLIEAEKLVFLEKPDHEIRQVFGYILRHYGFSEESSKSICDLLAQVGKVITHKYGGKIQRFLRCYGESMRDELVKEFEGVNLDKSQLTYAISYWLQNVLSMPISLQHEAVIKFCQNNKLEPTDLWKIVDELDLNLAVIDDLLEMDLQMTETMNNGSEEVKGDQ